MCQLPYNLGVGGAMRAGYRYALRHRYDAAVQVDADGQHDPTYLKLLVDGLEPRDIVVGARFAGEGEYRARGPRRWAMRLLAFTLTRLAGNKMTDVTSGFRAANRRAIRVFADHYPAEYLGDTVESLVIAHPGRLHGHPGAGLDADPVRRPGQPDPAARRASTCSAPSSRSGSPWCASGRPPSRTCSEEDL